MELPTNENNNNLLRIRHSSGDLLSAWNTPEWHHEHNDTFRRRHEETHSRFLPGGVVNNKSKESGHAISHVLRAAWLYV